jgi:PD-(D/E)XK nuclease superfamily
MNLPVILDSTMLSTYRSCPRKFWAQYVVNARGEDESVHLHAGAAWADAMEATRIAFFQYGETASSAEDTGKAVLRESWGDPLKFAAETKNLKRMTEAFDYYHTQGFPLEDEHAPPASIGGKLMVECSFAVPLGLRHPSGEEFIFVGRADCIVQHAGGLWLLDDKTTGGSLGSNWESQWKRRGQFSGYVWALRQQGIDIDGVLVRGLAIQKTQFKHQEVVSPRHEFQVDEWVEQTALNVADMIEQWTSDRWRASLGESCTNYGKECAFMSACLSPHMRDSILAMPRARWNPTTRVVETL